MEAFNMKDIWKSNYTEASNAAKYSVEDIRAFKQGQSSRAFRSGRMIILFDLFFKGLFLIALVYLWIIHPGERLFSIGVPVFLILLLMVWESTMLKKLPSPASDESVVKHLEKHLHFLQTTYLSFIFTSALTSLLLVYTGFLYNFSFKYNQMSLPLPSENWVIYAFLAAAFLFSFIAQKITHQIQISDIVNSIKVIKGNSTTGQPINYLRKKRKRQWIIGILLVLLGILFFIVILLK
jgi:hypothetical protein